MPALALAWSARSDRGRRQTNEDAWFASRRLVAVADGVGGASAGEVASRAVIDSLVTMDKLWLEEPLDDALLAAVRHGNEKIAFLTACRPSFRGMGTTLTATALSDDGAYVVANIGDSRTYLLRDGALSRVTHDESLVQALIDAGHLDPAGAREHPQRSVVTRALDGTPGTDPALGCLPARPGDRLMLCSDGLSDVLDDEAILALLSTHPDRDAAVAFLVEQALAAGARDNVSVVVADAVAGTGPGWRR